MGQRHPSQGDVSHGSFHLLAVESQPVLKRNRLGQVEHPKSKLPRRGAATNLDDVSCANLAGRDVELLAIHESRDRG